MYFPGTASVHHGNTGEGGRSRDQPKSERQLRGDPLGNEKESTGHRCLEEKMSCYGERVAQDEGTSKEKR